MKKFFIILLVFLLIDAGLLYFSRAYTPQIKDENGKTVSENTAVLEKIKIGGIEQCILIRSRDISNPILLFLHGGPGMPMMYLAHKFQRQLEEQFTVVQWDQRGAGKSYNQNIPIESINVEQFISDTHELVQHLRRRFNKDKIHLAGHSWGSYLGMLSVHRYPELFASYTGIGQIVHSEKAREIKNRFIREQAEQTGNAEAIEELDTKGDIVLEKWLFRFGGELHEHTGIMPFIITGLLASEYNLHDSIIKIKNGSSFSSEHMKYNAVAGELIDEIYVLSVPVYFFTGRYDYVTPSELVEEYYQKIQAPDKKLVFFENSAHFPFFEEPEQFAAKMIDTILKKE